MSAAMTHPFFVSPFFQYMFVLNIKSVSTENVINVMSYLFSWSKVNAAQILLAETVCGGNGAEGP